MKSSAILSPDRKYRYALVRQWDEGDRRLVIIGLNPSTADETADDPTIRRCIGFAKREGCSSLVMLNLFGYRATKPSALRETSDPVGPENDFTIKRHVSGGSALIIAAWGADGGRWPERVATVRSVVGGSLSCFGVTQFGHPRHPLYVRRDANLYPWEPAR